jgi:acyl-CoA thioester hydrolase
MQSGRVAMRELKGTSPLRQSLQPSRDPADYTFVHRLRTRFAETDAMGVVHHAAYLPYLEVARVEFLRSIGHPYDEVRADPDEGGREFPVLEAWVQYRGALAFDDEVDISLVVGAVTRTTFQIAYLLSVAGQPRATAVTVHGCVDRSGRPTRLPEWVRRTFGSAATSTS